MQYVTNLYIETKKAKIGILRCEYEKIDYNKYRSAVRKGIDILENELIEKYPELLEILLCDRTTGSNIFWATTNYEYLGDDYLYNAPILTHLITGKNGNLIMPRVHKDKNLQQIRSKEMAEIFTPSWVCNSQNNLIDKTWFGRENVFNTETISVHGLQIWETNKEKIQFPKGKTWKDYVNDTRLEIACGEAPYIASRYDTTTDQYIPIEKRIGIIDRKLRVINENVDAPEEWILSAQSAYKNTYAYEWQGDNLFLARESMLISFIENFLFKFGQEPYQESILTIAKIISWNVWQMDGLKGVVPNSCQIKTEEKYDLFGNSEKEYSRCKGCESENIFNHNGKYCIIMDWDAKNSSTGEMGNPIKFINLLKN